MSRLARRETSDNSDTFVVDGDYLRSQAGEAIRTFVAPLAGVYWAAVGSKNATGGPKVLGKKRKSST